MIAYEINSKAFALIKKLEQKPKSIEKIKLTGSLKEQVWDDWSDKFDKSKSVIGKYFSGKSVVGVTSENEKIEIGFTGDTYNEFSDLVKNILELPQFKNKISYDFIERESFEWVQAVYVANKANTELLDHLNNVCDGIIQEHQFIFPITNLNISVPFKIGFVEITYFTNEDLDNLFQYYQTMPKPMTEEEFAGIYRNNFQGRVIARAEVNAERKKGEEIARNRMEVSLDVIKIFGLSRQSVQDVKVFDLEYKVNMPMKTTYLNREKHEIGYKISMEFQNSFQFQYPLDLVQYSEEYGINLMSEFIKKESDDEFYRIIINGIKIYSAALSISDLHLRAIMIITVLESLLIEDNDSKMITKKTKERIANLLYEGQKERNDMIDLFEGIYQIRHKMVHKAIKLPIDHNKYNNAQVHIVQFLRNLILIYNKRGATDKPSLISFIESLT